MEISLIKNVVTVTKRTDKFDLDFGKLVEHIIKNWGITINELSEGDKEDIITDFDCYWDTYLSVFLNIEIYDLPDDESDGYDIDDNSEVIEKIKNEFAEYVYNL